MQLSLTHFCALVFPLLTVGASLSVLGLGCCRLGSSHFCAHKSSHSLDDGHPSLYGKRMCQVTFGNNLSIDVENNSPFLTVRASSYYVDGDVHDLDLNLHAPHCCIEASPVFSVKEKDVGHLFARTSQVWAAS